MALKHFNVLKKNVEKSFSSSHFKIFDDKEKNSTFWDQCQVLFEIACLLHDCGHAPFSHTLEFYYNIDLEGTSNLRDKLVSYLGSKEFKNDFRGQGAPHERMSALLVCTEYKSIINNLLKKYDLFIDLKENVIEFIARMIIGCHYKTQSKANQIKNCLISLLNSNSIDVDSLDYIIRDARMSGIDNMSIDIDRLLSSVTLVELTELHNVSFHDMEIAATVLDGKIQNHAHVTGKINGNLDAKIIKQAKFYGSVKSKGFYRTKPPIFLNSGEHLPRLLTINGMSFKDENIPDLDVPNTINMEGLLTKNINITEGNITFFPSSNLQIDLNADEINFSSTYIDCILNGTFSGTILGNLEEDFPNAKVICTLGFHKSSLSVIQNVVLARNYEYQWIYSHHKVVYYSNYLMIELLRKSEKYMTEHDSIKSINELLSWKTMVSKNDSETECGACKAFNMYFWRPTDSDLLNIFKQCKFNPSTSEEYIELLNQYLTRKFRKSLWKSYAEMYNFLSEFTKDNIDKLFRLLIQNSRDRLNEQYGYLNDKWQKEFSSCYLDDVVWVNGDSKLKNLDPNMTFIHFKDRDMTYGAVSSLNDIKPIHNINMFYLYYKPVEGEAIKYNELIAFLKRELSM